MIPDNTPEISAQEKQITSRMFNHDDMSITISLSSWAEMDAVEASERLVFQQHQSDGAINYRDTDNNNNIKKFPKLIINDKTGQACYKYYNQDDGSITSISLSSWALLDMDLFDPHNGKKRGNDPPSSKSKVMLPPNRARSKAPPKLSQQKQAATSKSTTKKKTRRRNTIHDVDRLEKARKKKQGAAAAAATVVLPRKTTIITPPAMITRKLTTPNTKQPPSTRRIPLTTTRRSILPSNPTRRLLSAARPLSTRK